MFVNYKNYQLQHDYINDGFKWVDLIDAENDKINILTKQFMTSGAIFSTYICRFHISTVLSELNIPLSRAEKKKMTYYREIYFILCISSAINNIYILLI